MDAFQFWLIVICLLLWPVIEEYQKRNNAPKHAFHKGDHLWYYDKNGCKHAVIYVNEPANKCDKNISVVISIYYNGADRVVLAPISNLQKALYDDSEWTTCRRKDHEALCFQKNKGDI